MSSYKVESWQVADETDSMYFADAYGSISDCKPQIFLRNSVSKNKVLIDFHRDYSTYTITDGSEKAATHHEIYAMECTPIANDNH